MYAKNFLNALISGFAKFQIHVPTVYSEFYTLQNLLVFEYFTDTFKCCRMASTSSRKCCVAYGCSNNPVKDSNLSFHRFPSDTERKDKWANAVRREGWKPTSSSVLCSVHFTRKSVSSSIWLETACKAPSNSNSYNRPISFSADDDEGTSRKGYASQLQNHSFDDEKR